MKKEPVVQVRIYKKEHGILRRLAFRKATTIRCAAGLRCFPAQGVNFINGARMKNCWWGTPIPEFKNCKMITHRRFTHSAARLPCGNSSATMLCVLQHETFEKEYLRWQFYDKLVSLE